MPTEKQTCTTLLSVFFGLVPIQKYYLLLELSFFCFVLVHTRVRPEMNYYMIIYAMKKHRFTWTYILNFLIGLLSFFWFKLTITYDMIDPKKRKLAHQNRHLLRERKLSAVQEENRKTNFQFKQVHKIWKNTSNNGKPQIITQITTATPKFNN